MFDEYRVPKGYDQIAPGRDLPQRRTPLQNAIMEPQPQVGASHYPVDPSLKAWRSKPPGGMPKVAQPAKPTDTNPNLLPGESKDAWMKRNWGIGYDRELNPTYWDTRMLEKHPDGKFDYEYWGKRMQGWQNGDAVRGPYAGTPAAVHGGASMGSMSPLMSAIQLSDVKESDNEKLVNQLLMMLGAQV